MSSSFLQTGKFFRSEWLFQKNRIKIKKVSKKKDSGKEAAKETSDSARKADGEAAVQKRMAEQIAMGEEEPSSRKREESVPRFSMAEAIVWSEILGDPVSVRRRKKRMERFYGNQGDAGRR